MATATQEAPKRELSNPYKPVVWDEYEAEKADRTEAIKAKRPLMRQCLDHETAKDHEDKKPKFRFKVTCTYSQPDADDGGRLKTHNKVEVVNAHNENDAWALFCDRIKTHPSPHAAERTIEKLGKIN